MNDNFSARVHPAASAGVFWVMGDQVMKRGKLEGTGFNVIDGNSPTWTTDRIELYLKPSE